MTSRTTPVIMAGAFLLVAQQGHAQEQPQHTKTRHIAIPHVVHPQGARSGLAPLWGEDFENGMNGWVAHSAQGGVEWQLTSTGNTGGYTNGPLESTTGYPGGHWITADSDAQGTAGQSENATITSPPILGLDTVQFVLLRFEQSFRQLNDDQTLVEVSGDGGDDWTTYPVNSAVGGNMSTPGAPASETITLNISNALSGGASDIRIRFRWISEEGFTYSWQVDDVALIAALTNDLAIRTTTYAAWEPDGVHWEDMPCTVYPLNEQRELHFRGEVQNMGSAQQTGVRMVVSVGGPEQYAELLTSGSADLAPGETHVFTIDGYTPPGVVGDYAFHMTAMQNEQEEAPEDNSSDSGIRIDPFTFARDEGLVQGEQDNGGQDYEIGNRFWTENFGETLHGVDVAVGPSTEPGALIEATVYDEDLNVIAQSDIHTVTADEINDAGGSHFIPLRLFDPLPLLLERLYLVCLHAYGMEGGAWIASSGASPAQASLLYRTDVSHWYYVTNTPMVRMNLDPNVGISEGKTEELTAAAHPNVFDELTTVSFNSDGDAARWELRDLGGRSVNAGSMGTPGTGLSTITIPGEGLGNGVYLLSLLQGDRKTTLRLVHQARR